MTKRFPNVRNLLDAWLIAVVVIDAADWTVADCWLLSKGNSNMHRNLESINCSGLTSFHSWSTVKSLSGLIIDCTINLCLFFSFGSKTNGWRITEKWTEKTEVMSFNIKHYLVKKQFLTCNFNGTFWIQRTTIWTYTVFLGSCGLYFE